MTVVRIETGQRHRSAVEKAIARNRALNPTSPSFSADALRAALENIPDPTARDRQVVEFAFFIARTIRKLNEERLASRLYELHPRDRLELLLTAMTHEVLRIHARAVDAASSRAAAASVADQTQRMRGGLRLRSLEALESAVDAFAYIASEAYGELRDGDHSSAQRLVQGGFISEDLLRYINFAPDYRTLLEHWQLVLHAGYDIRRTGRTWIISQSRARSLRRAVGEIRKYRQTSGEIENFLQRWRRLGAVPPNPKGLSFAPVEAHDFRVGAHGYTFAIRQAPSASSFAEPAEIARIMLAFDSWKEELSAVEIDLQGRTCAQLFQAWYALRKLASDFVRATGTDGGPPDFSPPIFEAKLLTSYVSACLTCDREEAEARIAGITHPGNPRVELFSHPVLTISSSSVGLFVPGLLFADYERVLVQLIHQYVGGGADKGTRLARKGSLYEQTVRSSLCKAVERAAVPGWSVEPRPISFPEAKGRKGREFDLLVCFGKTLIVGEVKCSSHPADPNEIGERERLIDEAASQVKEQVEWLARNWHEFTARVRLPLQSNFDDQIIIPAVIVDGCYGAGFPIVDVPVLDGGELRHFIGNRTWPAADTGIPATSLVPLYEDPTTAEVNLRAFLEQPPSIMLYLESASTRRLDYKGATIEGNQIRIESHVVPLAVPDTRRLRHLGAVARTFRDRTNRLRRPVSS